MAAAAEQRQKSNEGRGIKDPEALKLKQKKREEIERKAELNQGQGDSNLKVTGNLGNLVFKISKQVAYIIKGFECYYFIFTVNCE